ncbi:MAG TPA: ATPase domain-containing protein [Silvibacterium sp.]|nr:ATPase domain-containing protein [Silvibacterium sp.]
MAKPEQPARINSGVPGLDDILLGGMPQGHTFLVEGRAGTGKTTLGLQFCIEGHRNREKCLYVTLSESKAELVASANGHGWSLDGISIAEFVPEEASLNDGDRYTVFHPGEIELASTVKKLIGEIDRVNPERLVIDSLSEFRLMSQEAVRYRRQLLSLKQYFIGRNTSVLLLDDLSPDDDNNQQVLSIVHGVIRFTHVQRSYGVVRRRIEIVKVRSSAYRGGFHDYTLGIDGVIIYPRLIAAEHPDDFKDDLLSSGIASLDAMFHGGIDRGSSTLVLGPAGVGKSSVSMQYAYASAVRKERAVIYSFDETLRTVLKRARSLSMKIEGLIKDKHLYIEQMDAAELSPGEFTWKIRREVEENGARVIVIDSLNGFLRSMSGEADLALHLHELLAYLNQRGVDTFIVLTQQSLIGERPEPVDVSYLADTLLILRYFEAEASVRRAISVLKKRSGGHEDTIRELQFSGKGIQVGEPLTGFKGILSGLPETLQIQEPSQKEK